MLQPVRSSSHMAAYLRRRPARAQRRICLHPATAVDHGAGLCGVMPLLCRIRVSFPESQETAMRDLREIGPTHSCWRHGYGSRPRPTPRPDHGRGRPTRRACSAWAVAVGTSAVERGRRHRLAELLVFAPLRDRLGFAHAQVRRHRRRRAGTRHVQLLPCDGRAAPAALRPDRGRRRLHAADGRRIDCDCSGVPFDDTEIEVLDPDESGVGEIAVRHPGCSRAISAPMPQRAPP